MSENDLRDIASNVRQARQEIHALLSLMLFLALLVIVALAITITFLIGRPAKADEAPQKIPSPRVDGNRRGPQVTLSVLKGSAPAAASILSPVRVRSAAAVRTPKGSPSAPPRPAPAARRARMRVTAYCPGPCCCGKYADGITASGRPVTANGGKFVAADKSLPFGTMITIPGYNAGRPVPVLDRGGAIKGNRLDLYFADHKTALAWGVRNLNVTIHGKDSGT